MSEKNKKNLVFHVDVNSAYLSWQAARMVAQGQEDIRLIPAVIGGDREKRTGVVLAKSIPAKKCGVLTGEPVAFALRKCPDLITVRPDFSIYEESSRAFMDVCREFTPVVEKYSIDECFLDMSGMGRVWENPLDAAYAIKDEIKNRLGFTVNIGVSSNKILAKMASDFEKPDKVHTLFPEEIEDKLWPLPVRFLHTVGKVTEQKLKSVHIETVGDLARADLATVQAVVGAKAGRQIHQYARGIDPSPVLKEAEEAKGYSHATTLDEDVTEAEVAYGIIQTLADSAAYRMRADGVKAYCVSVNIRSNTFKDTSHQRKLQNPTDISIEILEVCKKLFDELWDGKTPLRLIGVALTDVTKEDYCQQSLFAQEDEERDRLSELDKLSDTIKKKYGADKISWGSMVKK